METDTRQATAPDSFSSTFKIFLFVLPSTLVEHIFGHGHWVLFGLSFVAGAVLQALFPPRKYRLPLILGLATVAAIVIPVIAHFARWQ